MLDHNANTYAQELKKWKEEQVKQFQSIAEQQRADLDARKRRLETLMKQQTMPKQLINEPTRTTIPSRHIEITLPKYQDPMSSKKEEKPVEPSISRNVPVPSTNVPTVTENLPPEPSVSFEDVIKKQMQGINEANQSGKPKPKRTFLRKGEGHKKYSGKSKPTSKRSTTQENQKTACPPSKLNLKKPAEPTRKVDASSARSNEASSVPHVLVLSQKQKNAMGTNHATYFSNQQKPVCPRKEKEDRELAEFELLEDAAKNASFCSDSSIVKDVLSAENTNENNVASVLPESILFNDDIDTSELVQYINELEMKKKNMEQQIMESENIALDFCKPSCLRPQYFSASSSSSPVVSREKVPKNVNRNVKFDVVSSSSASSVIGSDLNASVVKLCGPDTDHYNDRFEGVDGISSSEVEDHTTAHLTESDQSLNARLKDKMKELEDEIAIYKRNNAHLSALHKQKDEEMESFRKKMKEFESSKEEEIKRIDKEVSEKRIQLRRERLNLERCRKFRKDQPDKKIREEISSLKHQVVSLQEELKKQSFKSSSECKRLRKMLDTVEKERDSLKQEVESLNTEKLKLMESCQAKQRALKEARVARMAENGKCSEIILIPESSETESSNIEIVNENVRTSVKQHVRFNLEPCVAVNSHEDVVSTDPSEIMFSDRVEKILPNGQKEIVYASGTKKFVSADGQHRKYIYYNGDVKEIFPDKKSVYTFADGTVETTLVDGIQIYDYPNGQKEIYYPDGKVETILLDGTKVLLYPDGLYEIIKCDGMRMKLFSDVMEVIEFPLGDKEYRTTDFVKHVYADGTTKTVFQSGIIETAYSDGRLKVKNKEGKIIVNV